MKQLDMILSKHDISIIAELFEYILSEHDWLIESMHRILGFDYDKYRELEDFDELCDSSDEPFYVVERFCNQSNEKTAYDMFRVVSELNKEREFIYHMLHSYDKAGWDDDIVEQAESEDFELSDKHVELYNEIKEYFIEIQKDNSFVDKYYTLLEGED